MNEQKFFARGLRLMPWLIRKCGFIWFYPDWEPRLWNLYEICELTFTSSDGMLQTEGIKSFQNNATEMLYSGVEVTLLKDGYRCSDIRNQEHSISWMGLLVLRRRLRIDTIQVCRMWTS